MLKCKTISKCLSVFLSILFLIELAPMQLIASAYSSSSNSKKYFKDLISNSANCETENNEILCEVIDERDAFSKTYEKTDGSYVAVLSQEPIHYFSEGAWKDIDNTLRVDGESIVNEDNSFDVSFPKSIGENKDISIQSDNASISFSLDEIQESIGNINNDIYELSAETELPDDSLIKNKSEVIYENIASDTDLQYVVLPNGVKENIIISNKESVRDTYSFTINANELNYVVNDDSSVDFFDSENTKQFSIPKPVMIDANMNNSYDIIVNIDDNSDGTISLQYTPSKYWLEADERAYPITIDPIVYIDTYPLTDEWIKDTYVLNTAANSNFERDLIGCVCDKNGVKAEMYSKINIEAIRERFSDDVVFTDAQYCIAGDSYGGKILAKEIIEPCDLNTVTYNTKPQLGNEIYDYYTCPYEDEEEFADAMADYAGPKSVHFNITNLLNKWMNGETNNGFAMVSDNDGVFAEMYALGTDHSTNTLLFLNYTNKNVSNPLYNSHSQSVGRAGTCYVNDFSQGLTICRSELFIDGNNLPVSTGMNYSSAYSNFKNFMNIYAEVAEDYDSTALPVWPYGNNWIPNYYRGIVITELLQLVYFTEDGGEIDFNIQYDEDGINFTEINCDELGSSGYSAEAITTNDDINIEQEGFCEFVIIKRPDGSVEHFNSRGLLASVTNEERPQQEIRVVYNSDGFIDYIKDGADRKYDYVYDSTSGLIAKVRCLTPDGAVVKTGNGVDNLEVNYTFTDRNLTGVTFADGKSVHYSYDSNNHITSVENIDGYHIDYAYDDNGRITNICEAVGSNNTGAALTYTRLSNNQIKVTGNTDDEPNYEIYQFDSLGVPLYSINKNGFYSTTPGGDSSSLYISSTDSKVFSKNILKNSSFEEVSISDWAGSAHFSRTQVSDAYSGNYVLAIDRRSNTTCSKNQKVDVNNPGVYTFSAYVKSLNYNSGDKLTLKASAISTSNVIVATAVTAIENTNNEWMRYSATLNAPNNVKAIQVELVLDNASGTYYIDDVQLENSLSESKYNYIENGAFTNSMSGWVTVGDPASIVESNVLGKNVDALNFNGGTNSENAAYTTISIDGKKGETYNVGGWFKGLFVPSVSTIAFMDDPYSFNFINDRNAQIEVSYQYFEDNSDALNSERIVIPFSSLITDWQFASKEFILKGDTNEVTVLIRYNKNANSALFTNFELTKDEDSINLNDVEISLGEQESTCPCENCEEYNCLCNCVDEVNCNCIQCKRRSGEVQKDSFGNVTRFTIYDGIKYIETTATYTSNGNYKASETDADNQTTRYEINNISYTLEKLIHPNGTNISYVYDAYNLLSAVCHQNSEESVLSSASYTYIDDRIASISHNGFSYNFSYDVWGQLTEISVNSQPIITYTYGQYQYHNRLIAIQYYDINNTHIDYIYNLDGSVQEININNLPVYNFTYNVFGELTQIEANGRIVKYTDGRIDITSPSEQHIYTSYINDEDETVEIVGDIVYTSKHYDSSYDQTSGNTTEKSDIITSNNKVVGTVSEKDWFGRTTNKIVKTKSAIDTSVNDSFTAINTEYSYFNYENDKTSNRISTYVNKIHHGTDVSDSNITFYNGMAYDYDENGNIIAEYDYDGINRTIRYSYVYDELNQLVRCNDNCSPIKATYVYTYDDAGNITSKSEYTYSPGENLGVLRSTVSYAYDNVWSDKLVKINGNDITYDNIGNPLNYYDGATMTWTGRQLDSYQKGNKYITYSYDENGLRHEKKVYIGSQLKEVYNYVWAEGKLISQVFTEIGNQGTETYSIRFIYDEFGEAQGFILNDTDTYLYLKNAFGDTVCVANESGEIVIDYTYNAWGKTRGGHPMNDSDLSIKMIKFLPFAYRGYCYDSDTQFYYLQSRYYDPEICRFINTDDAQISLEVIGNAQFVNLFAYCENNPIMYTDYTGYFSSKQHKQVTNSFSGIFKDAYFKKMHSASADLDLVYSPLTITSDYYQSFHFNVNKKGDDSRFLRYQELLVKGEKLLKEAAKYKKDGKTKKMNDKLLEAFKYFGYALHPLQDYIAHSGPDGQRIGYIYNSKDNKTKIWYNSSYPPDMLCIVKVFYHHIGPNSSSVDNLNARYIYTGNTKNYEAKKITALGIIAIVELVNKYNLGKEVLI